MAIMMLLMLLLVEAILSVCDVVVALVMGVGGGVAAGQMNVYE